MIAAGIITPRFLFRRYDYPNIEFSNGYPVLRSYVRKYRLQRFGPEKAIPQYRDLGLTLYRDYTARFGTPDLIHAHNVQFAGFIAQAIHEADGVPYVITEHSTRFLMGAIPPGLVGPVRASIQHASAVAAVSRALANALQEGTGFDRVTVLPNVVESEFLDAPLRPSDRGVPGTVFLSIGSLEPNKNHASLIQAFASHFRGQMAQLRLGGTGPLDRRLRTLARQLGVEGQVSFLGHLDRAGVLGEMQAAGCFVLPSHHETFGVVLIEALACGTPVIATRCGGPEDIINEGNGLLVSPGDSIALGEAMASMVRGRHAYVRASLREECRARFGEQAFVASATRLYEKALGAA